MKKYIVKSMQDNYISTAILLPATKINNIARQKNLNIFTYYKDKSFIKYISEFFKVSIQVVSERLKNICTLNLDNYTNKITNKFDNDKDLISYLNQKNNMMKEHYLSSEECDCLIKYIVKYSLNFDKFDEK